MPGAKQESRYTSEDVRLCSENIVLLWTSSLIAVCLRRPKFGSRWLVRVKFETIDLHFLLHTHLSLPTSTDSKVTQVRDCEASSGHCCHQIRFLPTSLYRWTVVSACTERTPENEASVETANPKESADVSGHLGVASEYRACTRTAHLLGTEVSRSLRVASSTNASSQNHRVFCRATWAKWLFNSTDKSTSDVPVARALSR
jgi:hypothetical protein